MGVDTIDIKDKVATVVRYTKSVTLSAGTHTLSDAKSNGKYMCTQQASGTLTGTTLVLATGVDNAEVIYELATPTTETYTLDEAIPVFKGTTYYTIGTTIVPSDTEANAWCWRW